MTEAITTTLLQFISNVPLRDFFLNLDNLHDYLKYTFPKVRPKRPKRKDKKGQFLFYKNIIFCRWKPLPSSLKQRTKIKWCFNTGTTWSNPIYGRGDFGEHVLNTLLLKSRTRRRGFHYYVQGQVSHTSYVTGQIHFSLKNIARIANAVQVVHLVVNHYSSMSWFSICQ